MSSKGVYILIPILTILAMLMLERALLQEDVTDDLR